jgi:hypothetical protein
MTEKTQVLDQLLEDLAGEEISEYTDNFALDAEFGKYSEADEFVEIDSYH